MTHMFTRALRLPAAPRQSFFLWGPRQAGKSTLLRHTYPDARWLDLLKADEFRRYVQNPELLRTELEVDRKGRLVVIDEVQKIPELLDEVHWLIENRNVCFALCGSSARKLKRGRANLLGGRALRKELHGLTAAELGDAWTLDRMLNTGYLPPMQERETARERLVAYVGDYLREEIAAEGLVRSLPTFSAFLDVASLSDTELVNFSSIARDCGVSSHTIQGYFQILVDTLLGSWLPAFRRRPKRRVIGAPKFYFFDVGVVNVLAKRGELEQGAELYGKAFENWVHHELRAHMAYLRVDAELAYWRLASGIEVDFLIGGHTAIEAKASRKITVDHLRGLRHLADEYPRLHRRLVVCLEPRMRKTEDGILIVPAADFARLAARGELFE